MIMNTLEITDANVHEVHSQQPTEMADCKQLKYIDTKVWPQRGEYDYALKFECDDENRFGMQGSLFYSYGDHVWEPAYNPNGTPKHIPFGGSLGPVYIRGELLRVSGVSKTFFENNDTEVKVSGELGALDYNGEMLTLLGNYDFSNLFSDTPITDASELIFPIDAPVQCLGMFYRCRKLVDPPVLISTIISAYGYQSMFEECTSLVTPPIIKATEFPKNACYYMFANCKSLTSTVDLSVTYCEDKAFMFMYTMCDSLTEGSIRIKAADTDAVRGIFRDCPNLTKATVEVLGGGTIRFNDLFGNDTKLRLIYLTMPHINNRSYAVCNFEVEPSKSLDIYFKVLEYPTDAETWNTNFSADECFPSGHALERNATINIHMYYPPNNQAEGVKPDDYWA